MLAQFNRPRRKRRRSPCDVGNLRRHYLTWFTAYVLAVARFDLSLRTPKVQSRLEYVTGGALMALALRVAATTVR
jgi:hypothetical protein